VVLAPYASRPIRRPPQRERPSHACLSEQTQASSRRTLLNQRPAEASEAAYIPHPTMNTRIPSLIITVCLGVSLSALAQTPDKPKKPKPAPGADGTTPPPPKPDKPASPPPSPPATPAPTAPTTPAPTPPAPVATPPTAPPSAPVADPGTPKTSSTKSKPDKKSAKPKVEPDDPGSGGPAIIVRPPTVVIPPTAITPPIRIGPGVPERPKPGPGLLAVRNCGIERPHAPHEFRGPGGALLRCPGVGGRPGGPPGPPRRP